MVRVRWLLVAVVVVPALGACENNSVEREEFSTDGAVAAFYLSTQYTDPGRLRGVAGVIDADGGLRTLETEGMDNAQLSWTEAGLFFSDASSDYLADPELSVAESPKTDFQNGVVRLPGSRAHVAVYNDGASGEGSYQDQVVVTGPDSVDVYRVEGDYSGLATCGNRVVGVAPQGEAGRNEPGMRRQGHQLLLARVHPPSVRGAEEVLGSAVKASEAGVAVPTAPCRQGEITFLYYSYGRASDVQETLSVGTWNIDSGVLSSRVLTAPDGAPLDFAALGGPGWQRGEAIYFQFDAGSLTPNGELQWYAPSGALMQTDSATGATSVAFDTKVPTASTDTTLTQFDRQQLAVLHRPEGGDTLVLRTFDRASGELLDEVSATGLPRDNSLILRGFAVPGPDDP